MSNSDNLRYDVPAGIVVFFVAVLKTEHDICNQASSLWLCLYQ